MSALKVLVTGGGGYIGSILVPELLSAGYEVTVVDNFYFGQASLNSCAASEGFNVVQGDIRNEALMKSQLRKNDIIIPLAAFVGAPLCACDSIGATSVNHDAVLMMLKNLSPQQRVLMPTTNSAYGSGEAGNFATRAPL